VFGVDWPTNLIDVVPASSKLLAPTRLVSIVLVFILKGSKLGCKRVRLHTHVVEFFIKILTYLVPQRLIGAGLPTKIRNRGRLEPCWQEELDLVD
jgi:hypothetical protein